MTFSTSLSKTNHEKRKITMLAIRWSEFQLVCWNHHARAVILLLIAVLSKMTFYRLCVHFVISFKSPLYVYKKNVTKHYFPFLSMTVSQSVTQLHPRYSDINHRSILDIGSFPVKQVYFSFVNMLVHMCIPIILVLKKCTFIIESYWIIA